MPLSKTEIIDRGRNLLIKSLLSDDTETADAFFVYLEKTVATSDSVAFIPYEKVLLSVYLKHYDIALSEIYHTDSVQKATLLHREQVVTPAGSQFTQQLNDKFYGRKPFILEEIHNSTLVEEEKTILNLVVNNIFIYSDAEDDEKELTRIQRNMNDRCKTFFTDYPDSKYTDFIRANIYNEEGEYLWGYGLQILFLGSNMLNGNLSNYLSNSFCADLGFSVYYKRLILSLQTSIVTARTKQDITFPNDAVWDKGSKTKFNKYEINLGYRIVDNNWISIAPFAGIGFAELSPNGEDIELQPSLEEQKFRSMTYSAGMQFDFLIKSLYSYNQGTGFPVRLRICYSKPKFAADMTGELFSASLGVDICFRPKTAKVSTIRW